MYETDGKKGLITSDGSVLIDARYDEIYYPAGTDDYVAVVSGNQAYYLNEDGYKIAEPDTKYAYLSSISEGLILAKKGDKYGFLDSAYTEKSEFIWEDATCIYESLGAVKKGGKWAIVNEKLEYVTDYIYEDVVMDEWKRCSVNALIWVKNKGAYQLIDKEGNILTKKGYEEVKTFVSEEPCAVKKDDKWGFVNVAGEEVISCQYEDAKSFTKGFAPVADHSLWGLIDTDNQLVTDYSFDNLHSLNEEGIAPFEREGIWSLLQMKIYE